MEKSLGDILVKTVIGDITELAVDAIVNAANSDLWMGSGVAGAIKRKGGIEIEKEAISKGPIRPGEAVLTTAGDLHAKHVIHCAGMPPGGRATYSEVKSSVLAALDIAARCNLKSIAFPAIGAGVGGLSEEQSARAITEAICQFSKNSHSVKEITLVGLNKRVCDCFYKAVEECQE